VVEGVPEGDAETVEVAVRLRVEEAVREGDWKLVRRDLAKAAKEGTQAPAWQLFDVARDPKETTDVASAHPDVVTRLAAIADREYAESQRFPLARTR
jgi:arylsulfatase